MHNFTPTSATILGTEASLAIDGPFNMSGGFTIRFPDGTRLAYEEPVGTQVDGLHYEAAAVARAVAAGQLEVPQRPRAESIRTMAVADAMLARFCLAADGGFDRLPDKLEPSSKPG